jgi:hypothetical protein
MRTGTRGDRIQVAYPPDVYQDTAELYAELGLTPPDAEADTEAERRAG